MKKFSQKVVKCEATPPWTNMLMMKKKFLKRISHNLIMFANLAGGLEKTKLTVSRSLRPLRTWSPRNI
jgi:hypothetical protein